MTGWEKQTPFPIFHKFVNCLSRILFTVVSAVSVALYTNIRVLFPQCSLQIRAFPSLGAYTYSTCTLVLTYVFTSTVVYNSLVSCRKKLPVYPFTVYPVLIFCIRSLTEKVTPDWGPYSAHALQNARYDIE